MTSRTWYLGTIRNTVKNKKSSRIETIVSALQVYDLLPGSYENPETNSILPSFITVNMDDLFFRKLPRIKPNSAVYWLTIKTFFHMFLGCRELSFNSKTFLS